MFRSRDRGSGRGTPGQSLAVPSVIVPLGVAATSHTRLPGTRNVAGATCWNGNIFHVLG